MATVSRVARMAVWAPHIEEAVDHLGASVVSYQLQMGLYCRMVDQLCCQDLLRQIEVQHLTMVFWTSLHSLAALRRARYTFQGVSTIMAERVPGTIQLEGFIFAAILKLACIQIRAPLHHQPFRVGLMASVLSTNSQVMHFGEQDFSLLQRKQAIVEVPNIIISISFLPPSIIIAFVKIFTSRVQLSSIWFFLPHL